MEIIAIELVGMVVVEFAVWPRPSNARGLKTEQRNRDSEIQLESILRKVFNIPRPGCLVSLLFC